MIILDQDAKEINKKVSTFSPDGVLWEGRISGNIQQIRFYSDLNFITGSVIETLFEMGNEKGYSYYMDMNEGKAQIILAKRFKK